MELSLRQPECSRAVQCAALALDLGCVDVYDCTESNSLVFRSCSAVGVFLRGECLGLALVQLCIAFVA